MSNIKNGYKDPIFVSAMFSLIFFVLKNYGLLEAIGLDATSYQELVGLKTTILIELGIINKTGDTKMPVIKLPNKLQK